MSKQHSLYKAFSVYEILSALIWRAAATALFIYCLWHYDENRLAVIVVCALSLFLVLIIGDEEIEVYDDRIIQRHRSILNWLQQSNGKIINIGDLTSVTLEPPAKNEKSDYVFVAILSYCLPLRRSTINNKLSVTFRLKNGEALVLKTAMDKKKIERIVQAVSGLIKK